MSPVLRPGDHRRPPGQPTPPADARSSRCAGGKPSAPGGRVRPAAETDPALEICYSADSIRMNSLPSGSTAMQKVPQGIFVTPFENFTPARCSRS